MFGSYLDLKKEFPEAKPFNYREIFAPPSIEEMERMVGRGGGGSSNHEDDDVSYDSPGGDDGPEDDIPF